MDPVFSSSTVVIDFGASPHQLFSFFSEHDAGPSTHGKIFEISLTPMLQRHVF